MSKEVKELQDAIIAQKVASKVAGMHSMSPGKWYVQKFSDEEIYFHAKDVQKNGGLSGTQVTVDLTRPRAAPKAKKSSVPQAYMDLWKEIAESDLPANVKVHKTATKVAEEKEAVAPPGKGWEHVVKELKKNDEIDNPWALAWSMKNKGDKVHKKEALTGTSQLANTKQAMNIQAGLPENHLIDFPSGKWGFTGRVDVRLQFATKDGREVDLKDDAKAIQIAREHGPGLSGLKMRAWATPLEAMQAAHKLGQTIQVSPAMLAKHTDLEADLKKSGVKHKVH